MQTYDRYVDVITEARPGVMSRLLVAIGKSGLTVMGQEIERIDSESQRIRFRLTLAGHAAADLAHQIEAVAGVVRMDALVEKPPSAEELQSLLREAFEAVSSGTDVVQLVLGFGSHLPPDTRQACLQSLGRRVGNTVFQEQFSLGSPLAAGPALHRIVLPTLRQLVPASQIDDTRIQVEPCPFCRDPSVGPSCVYLRGLIRGLLELAPTTARVEVVESTCGHKATHSRCEFTISV